MKKHQPSDPPVSYPCGGCQGSTCRHGVPRAESLQPEAWLRDRQAGVSHPAAGHPSPSRPRPRKLRGRPRSGPPVGPAEASLTPCPAPSLQAQAHLLPVLSCRCPEFSGNKCPACGPPSEMAQEAQTPHFPEGLRCLFCSGITPPSGYTG